MRTFRLLPIVLVWVLSIGTGCATKRTNADLDQARVAYGEAVRGGVVDPDSSVQLYEASKEIDRAQNALDDKESAEVVSHYAFLGATRVKIAVANAETERSRKQASELTQESSRMRLAARTQQAKAAEQQAVQARKSADQAQMSAQQAQAEEQRARAQAEQAHAEAAAAQSQLESMERQLSDLDARQTKRGLLLTLGGVLFEFGQADLKPEARQKLTRVSGFMIATPNRQAAIEGYTDNVGSDSYNVSLSRRRAEAVRDFLVSNGVESQRLAAAGFGSAHPVVPNDSAEDRAKNRRVEILILNPGDLAADAIHKLPAVGTQ